MQVSSKKQCKRADIFDINIYYLLMSVIFITALVVIFKIQISDTNKMLTLASLAYLFVACIFLNDNTDISIDILGIETEEKETVRTGYLNLMIESLKDANFYMSKITILDDYSYLDVKPYLKRLNAIYLYLKRVNPPKQYESYHENILYQLEIFLEKYNEDK